MALIRIPLYKCPAIEIPKFYEDIDTFKKTIREWPTTADLMPGVATADQLRRERNYLVESIVALTNLARLRMFVHPSFPYKVQPLLGQLLQAARRRGSTTFQDSDLDSDVLMSVRTLYTNATAADSKFIIEGSDPMNVCTDIDAYSPQNIEVYIVLGRLGTFADSGFIIERTTDEEIDPELCGSILGDGCTGNEIVTEFVTEIEKIRRATIISTLKERGVPNVNDLYGERRAEMHQALKLYYM